MCMLKALMERLLLDDKAVVQFSQGEIKAQMSVPRRDLNTKLGGRACL